MWPTRSTPAVRQGQPRTHLGNAVANPRIRACHRRPGGLAPTRARGASQPPVKDAAGRSRPKVLTADIRAVFSGRGGGSRRGSDVGPREQLVDPARRVPARQAGEDVGEVGLGVDPVQLCALRRCTGSVGASPTRQLSLQPEAPGADQEVTNGLKHLGKRPLSGASGPCGPQRERTPSRPRKCPMWEPTHQLNGEGRRRRASERDTPPPIPPG
jgi:hypothetical protein